MHGAAFHRSALQGGAPLNRQYRRVRFPTSAFVVGLTLALATLRSTVEDAGAMQPRCTPSTTTICGIFTAYPVAQRVPHGIVFNPHGKITGLWFTNRTTDTTSGIVNFLPATGKAKQYRTATTGSEPGSINYAPDYSLWFTQSRANKVGTIGRARVITDFDIPTSNSGPFDITRGPNGNMWFTEMTAGKIGTVAPSGAIKEYTVGAGTQPVDIITGPDSTLWFTEAGVKRIGRLTTRGGLRQFDAGSERLSGGLTVATDNALWFGQESQVGRMTTGGKLTEFALPRGTFMTGAVFGGKGGGVLIGIIKRNGQGALVSVSPTGRMREYHLPQKYLLPIELAQTADGAYWMSVESIKKGVSVSTLYNLR
jgi:virginiamycin B lyase